MQEIQYHGALVFAQVLQMESNCVTEFGNGYWNVVKVRLIYTVGLRNKNLNDYRTL